MDLKSLEDWVVQKHLKQATNIVDVASFGGPTREYHWAKWKGKSAPKKTKARAAMSAAARKKLVGVNEGALGCEEKGEGIAQSLNVVIRRLALLSPSIP